MCSLVDHPFIDATCIYSIYDTSNGWSFPSIQIRIYLSVMEYHNYRFIFVTEIVRPKYGNKCRKQVGVARSRIKILGVARRGQNYSFGLSYSAPSKLRVCTVCTGQVL